jgi:hypothetical protein
VPGAHGVDGEPGVPGSDGEPGGQTPPGCSVGGAAVGCPEGEDPDGGWLPEDGDGPDEGGFAEPPPGGVEESDPGDGGPLPSPVHSAVLQSNGAAAAAHCDGGRCAGAPGMQLSLPSAVAAGHPGREVK